MKWVWDTDTDRVPVWMQEEHDKLMAERMCRKKVAGADLSKVLAMLFDPVQP